MIKSITVVDTWYWSINKISYNHLCLLSLNYVLQFVTELAKPFTVEMYPIPLQNL